MGTRSATVWVAACDADDCMMIAAPDLTTASLRPSQHVGRYVLLSGRMEAYAAADAAGWVRGDPARGDVYCPDHAHLAPPTPSPYAWRTAPLVPVTRTTKEADPR